MITARIEANEARTRSIFVSLAQHGHILVTKESEEGSDSVFEFVVERTELLRHARCIRN